MVVDGEKITANESDLAPLFRAALLAAGVRVDVGGKSARRSAAIGQAGGAGTVVGAGTLLVRSGGW